MEKKKYYVMVTVNKYVGLNNKIVENRNEEYYMVVNSFESIVKILEERYEYNMDEWIIKNIAVLDDCIPF